MKHADVYARFAKAVSRFCVRPRTFALALLVILVWVVTGPVFGYSDTWQLVINTGTTIVTFLMVFLIQNTQNRDSRAIHVKLDELIHAMNEAHDDIVHIEEAPEEELEARERAFVAVREKSTGAAGR